MGENIGEIKKFNVKIQGQSDQTFNVGANATNVYFSDSAISPFENKPVEGEVSNALSNKAQSNIYGNAYIRNNAPNKVDGLANNAAGNGKDYNPKDSFGSGGFSISYGLGSVATGHNATAVGFDCEARGWASHAEGWKTVTNATANYSHAEGAKTLAGHNIAHAEGDATQAVGHASHAEGMGGRQSEVTTGGGAQGMASHTEGIGNSIYAVNGITRSNATMQAELNNPFGYKNGQASHAEGISNVINGGVACHAHGIENTIGQVYASSVIGHKNTVGRDYCLAAGKDNTIESESSFAFGSNLNVPSSYSDCMFIGRYSNFGSGDANEPPALVIGAGDSTTKSNLLTIRYPKSGAASTSNKGKLYAKNVDAYFSTIHTDSVDDAQNIWKTVTWNFINNGNRDFCQIQSANGHTYLLRKVVLSISINEANRMLRVFFSPFDNMPSNWNTKNISTACVDAIRCNNTIPTENNGRVSGTKEDALKILDAISRLQISDQTSVYVTDGSPYKAYSCKIKPKQFFNISKESGQQATYGSFRIRSLTADFSGAGSNLSKFDKDNVENKFKSIKYYALAGTPHFTFYFTY